MTSEDPNKQNLSKCIDMADHRFENNGTMDHLLGEVKEVMEIIKTRQ